MKNVYVALFCVTSFLICQEAAYAKTAFPPKLFLSANGLALSSFPSRQTLTHTIKVDRTRGKTPVTWTAVSNKPWLTVTASGTTGGTLMVTATPGQLKQDKLYLASVAVSTNGGDFTDTENLNVGFWVGSTDPSTVTLQQNALSIATNPVTPIAYVADASSSILEYNVYSGELVATLQNVAPTVGAMEVSSDGLTLFAADTTNYKIIALDAKNGKRIAAYSLGYPINSGFNMVYARPFGQPALYAAGGPIIAFPSGDTLASNLPADFIAVTPDGMKLFGVTVGESPGSLYNYSVGRNGDALAVEPIGSTRTNDDNCQDLAVSHDGGHVYPACGAPYEFDVYDGKTLAQVQTLPANPYPNNIEVDSNDDVVGGINGLYQQDDVYVFDQKGFSLGVVPTTSQSYEDGQQTAAMKVSGDTTRVISVTAAVYDSSQTLMFRNLP
jgi:hypothetical protein